MLSLDGLVICHSRLQPAIVGIFIFSGLFQVGNLIVHLLAPPFRDMELCCLPQKQKCDLESGCSSRLYALP